MTADLIARVRAQGADLLPLGRNGLRVLRSNRLDHPTVCELRHKKAAVLRALEAELAATVIAYQCALRACRE